MRLLQMDGDRIVDARIDAAIRERALEVVAMPGTNRIDVVDVAASRHDPRDPESRRAKKGIVVCGMPAPRTGPRVEMSELHAQDGALQALHPVIESLDDVVITPLLAPVSQDSERVRVLGAVGRDEPGFAIRSKILARVEAEASEVADASDTAPFVLGAVRLRGVLDDDEPVAARDLDNRIHVRRLPIQMNRHDGPRPA